MTEFEIKNLDHKNVDGYWNNLETKEKLGPLVPAVVVTHILVPNNNTEFFKDVETWTLLLGEAGKEYLKNKHSRPVYLFPRAEYVFQELRKKSFHEILPRFYGYRFDREQVSEDYMFVLRKFPEHPCYAKNWHQVKMIWRLDWGLLLLDGLGKPRIRGLTSRIMLPWVLSPKSKGRLAE
jgi:hypothetical protein